MKMNCENNRIGDDCIQATGPGHSRSITRAWIGRATVLAFIAAFFIFYADNNNAMGAEDLGISVTASDIADNVDVYLDKTVTVSGEVEDVFGSRAFVIGGEEFIFDDELLVVSATPFPAVPNRAENAYVLEDDIIQVTGVVRKFVESEVEREIDFNLDPGLEGGFKNRPVLVAKLMKLTPRKDETTTAAKGAETTDTGETASAPDEPITDMLVVVTPVDSMSLVGKRVLLSNVKVQSVVSDRGFWVGPDDAQRLFVLLDEDLNEGQSEQIVDINQGQTYSISGVIKELPGIEEAKNQWGLSNTEATALGEEQVYLHVDVIDLASGSATGRIVPSR